MRWMSSTAIGSTPANGSSSRMKRGRVPSARAISTRRRSPPESDSAGACAGARSSGPRAAASRRGSMSAAGEALQLEDRAHVLLDRQLAEDRGLLRQVGEAQARAPVDRQVRELVAVEVDRAARPPAPGRRSCRSRWSCRRRWGRAGRRPRRSPPRARRPARPCATCSACAGSASAAGSMRFQDQRGQSVIRHFLASFPSPPALGWITAVTRPEVWPSLPPLLAVTWKKSERWSTKM